MQLHTIRKRKCKQTSMFLRKINKTQKAYKPNDQDNGELEKFFHFKNCQKKKSQIKYYYILLLVYVCV